MLSCQSALFEMKHSIMSHDHHPYIASHCAPKEHLISAQGGTLGMIFLKKLADKVIRTLSSLLIIGLIKVKLFFLFFLC